MKPGQFLRGDSVHPASCHLTYIVLLLIVFLYSGVSPAYIDQVHAAYFDQRVSCQMIIEDLQWSHRIWPKENKTPKPARSQVFSDEQIRAAVEGNLRMERALADLYNIEISTEMLQAELNRMASNTRMPKRLKQLFNALGNDPSVLGECLARPALVRRKLYTNYVWDNRYHGGLKDAAQNALSRADEPWALAQSGGHESVMVLVRKSDDTDLTLNGIDEAGADDGYTRIELDTEKFDQEVRRLTGMGMDQAVEPNSSDSPNHVGLRETETDFVHEEVLSQSENRPEVRTWIWEKTGFNEWWRSQSDTWPMAERSWDNLSGVQDIETQLVTTSIRAQTEKFEVMGSGKATADTWYLSGITARYLHSAIWTGTEMIVLGGIISPLYKHRWNLLPLYH